jgi:hypothetical protein
MVHCRLLLCKVHHHILGEPPAVAVQCSVVVGLRVPLDRAVSLTFNVASDVYADQDHSLEHPGRPTPLPILWKVVVHVVVMMAHVPLIAVTKCSGHLCTHLVIVGWMVSTM